MFSKWTHGGALLVILGAGASYDSLDARYVPDFTGRPPLTKDLVVPTPTARELMAHYGPVQPLVAELRNALAARDPQTQNQRANTLEEAMREYLGRRAYDVNVRSHVAAMRFYLRDLLHSAAASVLAQDGGITNYTSLVTRCFQWATQNDSHVCFVSFNYDHLLETACHNHFGLEPSELESYLAHDSATLLKPHGSVLWAWAHPDLGPLEGTLVLPQYVDRTAERRSIQAGEPDSDLTGQIFAMPAPESRVVTDAGFVPALPALALPITGKTTFVWPSEQDKFFREAIHPGSFGRVLTIGWRAAEAHFLELLSRLIPNEARLLIVTGDPSPEVARQEADIVARNLEPAVVGRSIYANSALGGFSNLMASNDLDWLLQ